MVIDQVLYEPLLHSTWVFISFRALNAGIYLSPGIYMSPASIWINTVRTLLIYAGLAVVQYDYTIQQKMFEGKLFFQNFVLAFRLLYWYSYVTNSISEIPYSGFCL